MRPLHKSDLFLAIVAFALAFVTYRYVADMIRSSESKMIDPSYKLIKLTAKSVPIKVRFASKAPEGYRLIQERVEVSPSSLVVIGPEALLEDASSAETAILDISQSTKKVVKRIPIESVSNIHLAGESYYVDVMVPIEKLDTNS